MLQKQEKRIWDTPLYADFPRSEYEDRVRRAREYMAEQKLDMLVLLGPREHSLLLRIPFAALELV